MEEDLKVRIGNRVRSARAASGLTQQHVAERIGMTRSSLANLEAGRNDTTVSVMAKIAAVLDVDLGSLILGEEVASPSQLHKVSIARVWEVTCETCDLILSSYPAYSQAVSARRDHIQEERKQPPGIKAEPSGKEMR